MSNFVSNPNQKTLASLKNIHQMYVKGVRMGKKIAETKPAVQKISEPRTILEQLLGIKRKPKK